MAAKLAARPIDNYHIRGGSGLEPAEGFARHAEQSGQPFVFHPPEPFRLFGEQPMDARTGIQVGEHGGAFLGRQVFGGYYPLESFGERRKIAAKCKEAIPAEGAEHRIFQAFNPVSGGRFLQKGLQISDPIRFEKDIGDMFFFIRTGLRHHRTALCDEPKLPGRVAGQQQGLSCLAFQHFTGQQDAVEARRVEAQQADNVLFQQVKRSIPGHSNGAKLWQGGKRMKGCNPTYGLFPSGCFFLGGYYFQFGEASHLTLFQGV